MVRQPPRLWPTASAPGQLDSGGLLVASGGLGIDDGIVLSTTLLLGVAVTLVYMARAAYVG